MKIPPLPLPSAKLRLSQQLIITFAVVVLVPLVGVSLIIYSINQTALRKELLKFTEHTVDTIYKDFETEMSWQKEQSQMMANYLLESYRINKQFPASANGIFHLSKDFEAVGLYDAQGQPIQTAYRNFTQLSPELRLPAQLPLPAMQQQLVGHTQENLYDVLYFDTGDPKDSPYYLRIIVPLATPEAIPGVQKAAYFVQLKQFQYLQNLIHAHESLYEHFYIIDKNGMIIAGPSQQGLEQQHISPKDFEFFKTIQPGVSQEFSTTTQTVPDAPQNLKTSRNQATLKSSGKVLAKIAVSHPKTNRANHTGTVDDSDDNQEIQKVFVKMPNINWGIIIESPYQVRQKFIKRANEQTILLIIACLVVVILLALVYVYGINRNFRQLIKGIKAMAEGNYFRRIRLITNFFTPYEIVYLTGEFNRMAKRRADAWDTLEKANEQLAKLDELKSNLIDTVSHELRTPLTSIKGYTSRLLRYDDQLDTEMRVKSLKIVKQQADRLTRLVEDLLVIPDLETASLRVYPDAVLLPELIERSVQFIQARSMTTQREIPVSYYYHGALSGTLTDSLTVLADPDRLEQILLNLLDNAVKYSEPETPIHVRVEILENQQVRITVLNECEPIPQEALGTLFDKFKRLDDSMVRTTRGSGLGLFITKGLVEAMGGEISLAYEEGCFQIHFTLILYHLANGESSIDAPSNAAEDSTTPMEVLTVTL